MDKEFPAVAPAGTTAPAPDTKPTKANPIEQLNKIAKGKTGKKAEPEQEEGGDPYEREKAAAAAAEEAGPPPDAEPSDIPY
jgi:hypothetical protein